MIEHQKTYELRHSLQESANKVMAPIPFDMTDERRGKHNRWPFTEVLIGDPNVVARDRESDIGNIHGMNLPTQPARITAQCHASGSPGGLALDNGAHVCVGCLSVLPPVGRAGPAGVA